MNNLAGILKSRLWHRLIGIWLSIIYAGGLFTTVASWVSSGKSGNFCVTKLDTTECFSLFQVVNILLPPIIAFTILMLCFGILFWLNISSIRDSRFYLLSYSLQGVLILSITFIGSHAEIAIMLCLMLILQAMHIFHQKRLAIIVLVTSFLLFIPLLIMHQIVWNVVIPFNIDIWPLAPVSSWWDLVGLGILVLLLSGYVRLYMRLMSSHLRLETAHQELEAAHFQLKISAEQIETLTRLTERQRLARELHDTLAQGLAGVMMQLQVASSRLSNQRYERAQESVQQAITYVRSSLSTARDVIDDLRSEITPSQEVAEAVQTAIDRFIFATGIDCTYEIGTLSCVPYQLHDHVLRVITEALTNIARHAQASHVEISIVQNDITFLIEIRDDGIGFDPLIASNQPGHYGLLGLRERARIVYGTFDLQSAPGKGTTLCFHFPLLHVEANVPDSLYTLAEEHIL